MSRSRKDGRRGGGHRQAKRQDKEYWSRRYPGAYISWGRVSKHFTHRYERRQGKMKCEE